MLPHLTIAKDHFFTFEDGISKEWLLTDGSGGYASSTVIGANSRRYHGLLIAAFPPHLRRLLILSKVEEVVYYGGEEFYLGVNRYPNTIHPQGHRYLLSFRQDPFPVFTYQFKDVLLEKEIFMPPGQKATALIYRLLHAHGPVALRFYPLLQCRSHHQLCREEPGYARSLKAQETGFIWTPPELPHPFSMQAPEMVFKNAPDWYYNLQYDRERARGFAFEEDCFCPGFFEGKLEEHYPLSLWASCPPPKNPYSTPQIENLYQEDKNRKTNLSKIFTGAKNVGAWHAMPLQQAAESFWGRDAAGNPLVIAGYPWFGFWGRDALIALPGLFLVTEKFSEAKEFLLYLGRHCRRGLIPKCFSEDEGEPDYASVDTSLWFIYALHQYFKAAKDQETVAQLLPVVEEIINAYRQGTDFGIKMDDDGLITAGQPGVPLTWMDTPTGGAYRHTPLHWREGKAVEVNALWYNALCAYKEMLTACRGMLHMPKKIGHAQHAPTKAIIQQVRESFNRLFWDPQLGYLYDVIGPSGPDGALRPNQLFAISLPFPALEENKWMTVFDHCWQHLFTPWGLRSLAPFDPRYRGRYLGDPRQREEAYHQGAAWSWLLGPFYTAFFKIHGRTPANLELARRMLEPLLRHLKDAGLGYISEIFDGDPPHRPKGCIAQAWSLGEVLRVLQEMKEK